MSVLDMQFNGEAPVKLKLWELQSTPSLPSLPGSFWFCVVAPKMVQSMGQMEVFDI